MVDFENDIKECIHVLQNGGTILYPTETVWGIGCDALNAAAVNGLCHKAAAQRKKHDHTAG